MIEPIGIQPVAERHISARFVGRLCHLDRPNLAIRSPIESRKEGRTKPPVLRLAPPVGAPKIPLKLDGIVRLPQRWLVLQSLRRRW